MYSKEQCEYFAESKNNNDLRNLVLSVLGNFDYFAPDKKIADLGCGPGLIDILLCEKHKDIAIDAFDASEQMLSLARSNIEKNGLSDRINLNCQRIQDINDRYDVLLSISTLHHFHDPSTFWNKLKDISNKNSKLVLFDFVRPNSTGPVINLINTVLNLEHTVFKHDVYNSFLASFTLDELKEQINPFKNLRTNVVKIGQDLEGIFIFGDLD
jgi:cyclopropane fatty-acyl-phospholipid synthase-like methyltransferase